MSKTNMHCAIAIMSFCDLATNRVYIDGNGTQMCRFYSLKYTFYELMGMYSSA
jgi:hypothetical protein